MPYLFIYLLNLQFLITMRTFKMFAFGGGFDAANSKLARMGQLLKNEFGEDVTLEDKIYYRDSIYTTPQGYGETSSCRIFAPNPTRNSVTFTLKISELFDGFNTMSAEGKAQGANLYFGIDKELLGETICSEITKLDEIYSRICKEQAIETPYHANGAYNFRGVKYKDTPFDLIKLDLGKEFILAVEVVKGKESGREYHIVRKFWFCEFSKPKSSGGARKGKDEDFYADGPTPEDMGIKSKAASPSAPSVDEMRVALINAGNKLSLVNSLSEDAIKDAFASI